MSTWTFLGRRLLILNNLLVGSGVTIFVNPARRGYAARSIVFNGLQTSLRQNETNETHETRLERAVIGKQIETQTSPKGSA